MAAVLRFEQKDKAARSALALSGPAQIIIFPGVRFERLDGADMHTQPEDGAPNGSGPMQRRAER